MAIVWAVLALPALGSAQAPAGGLSSSRDYLARMDRDGDGRVSLPEYQEWLSYGFNAMDRNRDGVLSTAEQPGRRGAPLTRAAHHARIAERFRRQDTNRDNVLSARELASPPQ